MNVLVLGRRGQLARELERACWPAGWQPQFAGRDRIDLAKPEQAGARVAGEYPGLVINAAAYTAVDQAESEPEIAMRINGQAPVAIARACAALHAPLVTVSTDYVFDGTKPVPYTEEDEVRPVSAYGRSKAEGEAGVRRANGCHLILRTSWVFSCFGANFVKTMLRLGAERDSLAVVADQRGKPTAASDLAQAIILASSTLMANRTVAGTYHVANEEATTWHDFAQEIFDGAKARGVRTAELRAITTAEYPTPARRPANSELATDKFSRIFSYRFRSWREPLSEVLDELLPSSAASRAS
ncbi:MAG: dTDP-4-dehydrorhamnose reductase [Alphaproteobacteria bacterium]|nr:dTDP-4-dehydrorhamnose reductase [Alphaproteobacteria bacterium]